MRISTFWYCLQSGLKNIVRNKWYSLAAAGTIIICIFLFGMCYSVVANISNIVKNAESNVGITTFFDDDVTDAQIKELQTRIAAQEQVESIQYTSAEEAWENYKAKYFADNPELADGFADNPLANSSSFTIYLKNIEDEASFAEYLTGLPGIRKVNYSSVAVTGLSKINRVLAIGSSAMVLVLILVSAFLITNTISMAISIRKEEIHIMRLIGATNFFIRTPFIVEGLVIGLFGAAVPLIAFYFCYGRVMDIVASKLSIFSGVLVFVPSSQIFAFLIPVSLVMGAGIGLFGCMASIRKHLRV